jgi:hypothetical protein
MNQRTVLDRLRSADPADGRHVVDDPGLRRERFEAILRSTSPDPLPARRRPVRQRLVMAAAAAALAIPCASLAASAVFSAHDVERGLPAGAKLLVGTAPACGEVKRDVVYDCKLKVAPAPEGSGAARALQPSWLGAVSLMVDGGNRINGGCRSQTGDGTAWRCYIGRPAADQRILDPRLLGNRIHDRCEPSASPPKPPVASPYSAAPGSAIILCGSRDVVGFAATTVRPSVRRP